MSEQQGKGAPAVPQVTIREAESGDAAAAGRIVYESFRVFQEAHGFKPDFPSVDAASGLLAAMIADPLIYGVVATIGDEIVGSNFLMEGDPIRSVGPIAVHPARQGLGIGGKLMAAVIARGADALGMRLVQDAFNAGTMALYTSLGFDPREPLALLFGSPRNPLPADLHVRAMTPADLPEADALACRVYGIARTAVLRSALALSAPVVLERGGRIAGYMTRPTFWQANHAVAETDADLTALISGAAATTGDGPLCFLAPIRRAGVFRWCIEQGMRIEKPMTLMSRGHYAEPGGAYLPSVKY
jgi:GNAT superfamily N-acetyltransferase